MLYTHRDLPSFPPTTPQYQNVKGDSNSCEEYKTMVEQVEDPIDQKLFIAAKERIRRLEIEHNFASAIRNWDKCKAHRTSGRR